MDYRINIAQLEAYRDAQLNKFLDDQHHLLRCKICGIILVTEQEKETTCCELCKEDI